MISSTPAQSAVDVGRRARMRVIFDRPLAPRSVTSSSVRVVSGARVVPLAVNPDPTLPGIVVEPLLTLDPDARWELRVEGVRDLDGVVARRHVVVFRTGRDASEPPDERAGWSEIAPVLARACGDCHGGPAPVLGLDLASAEGVRRTAIGIASQQTGGRSRGATGLAGMRRIEALGGVGSPEDSYLVYKILGDPHIAGDPMPPPHDAGAERAPSAHEIARIAAWIRAGAPTE